MNSMLYVLCTMVGYFCLFYESTNSLWCTVCIIAALDGNHQEVDGHQTRPHLMCYTWRALFDSHPSCDSSH